MTWEGELSRELGVAGRIDHERFPNRLRLAKCRRRSSRCAP